MTTLQIALLGQPRFARADHLAELTAAKAMALLAYLALARAPQPRDRLLALLWPESSADAARKNLRNILWTLRRALGEDLLVVAGDRLALDPAVAQVDVWEFERAAESHDPALLRAAADHYAGPLLDGLAFADAPEFELWLTAERERLAQLLLRALTALVALYRAAGQWEDVAAVARRALAVDNLQEPLHCALMESLARLGDRAAALRHYAALRRLLEHELGVAPLPETEALRDAIAANALRPAPPPRDRPPRRPPILGDPPRTPFVGRQAERAALSAALAAASQVRVVLLTGEMGIGKSRLWHEWAADLAPDLVALESHALAATRALPFVPLIELFSSHACVQRLFAPDSPVAPIWLAEVARLIPALRLRRPDLPAPVGSPPVEERSRLFEAFVQCLRAFESRPLVFFLDDAHWADQATLDWLGYLTHRMADRPLLLALAYRPDEAPLALTQLIAGWQRAGLVERLALPRLTDAEAMALVRALGGDLALAAQIQARGAGNPYFLIELCRAAPGDLPPALAALIQARLDRLPATARQVLQAAAVLEADFDLALLRRTSGRSDEETLDALDALLAAAVLVEQGPHLGFAHPLVAMVVRDGLSAARRAFLHRRAAEARVAAFAGRLPLVAGQVAAHYAEAGEPAQAARYAEMAAERALALAAPAEAANFYRQALTFEPTPARRMGLGRVLHWQGDLDGARAAFVAARETAIAQGDRQSAARASLELADTYLPSGRPDAVVAWAEHALADLDVAADPEAHAFAHFLLGAGRLALGQDLAAAEADLTEAARLATTHHLTAMAARSRFELGNALAQRGDLPAARSAFADAITLARAAGDQFQEALGYNNAAYHALLAGDLAAAREAIAAGLALTESCGLRLPLQYLYSVQGEIALAERQWEAAEAWFQRGLAEAERNHNHVQAANYRANLGLAARGRGDYAAALALLEAARVAAAELAAPHLHIQIDLWLVELAVERGDQAAAVAALDRAEARLAGNARNGLCAWAARLRAALEL